MKKAVKSIKYILLSGDELIGASQTIQKLCELIGVSFAYVYKNKHKDINGDGSWSFNYKGFNYTILNEQQQDEIFPNDTTRYQMVINYYKNKLKKTQQ